MSDENQSKPRPSHEVSFARITGKDERGKDVLGPARQIGSIWPRAGKDGDGIVRLDHMPEELRTQGGGVLFVRQIDRLREGRAEPKSAGQEYEREI